jgi:ABC-type nitrate/sulfonate/bicarbonate transport system substrate-binding protein
MSKTSKILILAIVWLGILGAGAFVYKWMNSGPGEVEIPFILWGGDVATFHANGGGLKTTDGLFARQGLKVKLYREDDFSKQIDNYKSGKSPFLRGTFSMFAQAADKLNDPKAPKMRPVIFLQLTWSAGDHMVTRENMKTLDDLKPDPKTGKKRKIALQDHGPHVGMLDDILRTANMTWSEIEVSWTKDVSGDDGPAAAFRKDRSIDGCFAISPEMTGLTGGVDKTGDGSQNPDKTFTVKGAHVLVSTQDMMRSIADVYACRKDFYDSHKDWVEKFAACYLKACEELVQMRSETTGSNYTTRYRKILEDSQKIFGDKDLPSLDDADGLIGDAVFVGWSGNRSFFTDEGNLSGFEAKQERAMDMAVSEKHANVRSEFLKNDFDYEHLKRVGELTATPSREKFRDNQALGSTIFAFNITFDKNDTRFTEDLYGKDFHRALSLASLFGNAVMSVRGHADTAKLVKDFLWAAEKQGIIEKRGNPGTDEYYLKGSMTRVDPANIQQILDLIDRYPDLEGPESKDPSTGQVRPPVKLKFMVHEAEKASKERAESVRDAIVAYAQAKNIRLDKTQIQPVGMGYKEPVVAFAQTEDDKRKNRRVEFRLAKVTNKQGAVGGSTGGIIED